MKKENPNQRILDNMKLHRKISREIQLESGIKFRSSIHVNRKRYNRKRLYKIEF